MGLKTKDGFKRDNLFGGCCLFRLEGLKVQGVLLSYPNDSPRRLYL